MPTAITNENGEVIAVRTGQVPLYSPHAKLMGRIQVSRNTNGDIALFSEATNTSMVLAEDDFDAIINGWPAFTALDLPAQVEDIDRAIGVAEKNLADAQLAYEQAKQAKTAGDDRAAAIAKARGRARNAAQPVETPVEARARAKAEAKAASTGSP